VDEHSKQKSQMRTVLEVSIVDLWAADANFVTESPNVLKQEIDATVKQAKYNIQLLLKAWEIAAIEFSTFP